MKKLTKLNLNDVEIMNDAQMKNILGGDGNGEMPDGYEPSPNARACQGKNYGDECIVPWGTHGICCYDIEAVNGLSCNEVC